MYTVVRAVNEYNYHKLTSVRIKNDYMSPAQTLGGSDNRQLKYL